MTLLFPGCNDAAIRLGSATASRSMGFSPNISQALPVIEIDLDGSLFGSAGLARTVIGPARLLS
ncbi:hypothetical protein [Paraburkholderia phytofirmans]|uniref:hypothetical protein n=1 Tax=Paraburkholderia phytofirmans TaxID=261302 RepID=UPI0011DF1407|nr:hypothetical protein [Paraburkholderia phytofirmans]